MYLSLHSLILGLLEIGILHLLDELGSWIWFYQVSFSATSIADLTVCSALSCRLDVSTLSTVVIVFLTLGSVCNAWGQLFGAVWWRWVHGFSWLCYRRLVQIWPYYYYIVESVVHVWCPPLWSYQNLCLYLLVHVVDPHIIISDCIHSNLCYACFPFFCPCTLSSYCFDPLTNGMNVPSWLLSYIVHVRSNSLIHLRLFSDWSLRGLSHSFHTNSGFSLSPLETFQQVQHSVP